MVDSENWPRPSEEELPDMYEEIHEMLAVIEQEIHAHFDVESRGADEHVLFANAEAEDYLAVLDANHEVMVPFFQKITGLPDREFDRQYGVRGIGQRLRNLKSSFQGHEDAERFADVLVELMPDSLTMESLFYTFFKMWEADQRRFYRMQYEEDFRNFLDEHGYANFKGNTLSGEPDFVIPDSEPYGVIGEIRVIQQKDREKRFKEFRSEATEAAANFPNARFVAIANLGAYIEQLDDREALRDAITKDDTSDVDAVFFHDEREEMLDQLRAWGISRQQKLE